ncbi:MAG: hypothetical protein DME05_04470 [Candidatus Rokuibacteriota bacterium]|nr:MAG: hypothetical protein DME05_04470 [Candidatus Rokubacteria bacterium]
MSGREIGARRPRLGPVELAAGQQESAADREGPATHGDAAGILPQFRWLGNSSRALWSNSMGDESHLVEAVRRGDPRAFEDLVGAYQHRVFGVALRMLGNRAEAEEVAQEVFLRVHKAIGDFRGEAKLSTWLYAIASRLCLNRLASGERRAVREGEETLTRLASGRPGPGDELERSELEAALHRAIAELPEERRIVVVLRDLEGLAYEEIAAALELELGTVRSRLHRARMDLKAKLERFLP